MNVQTPTLRPTSRRTKRHDLPLDRGTAIRETAELTAAILESFPGYVALLDATGYIFSANTAWIDLHAERASEGIACAALGENYREALRSAAVEGHDHAARISDTLDEVLGPAPTHRAECTCTTSDRKLLAIVAQRLNRPAGGAVLTAVDVSSWAASARALQQAQRDLMHAAQLAVGGELVGAITHDLRQPLTSIQMNLEIALHLLHQKPADVTRAIEVLDDAGADSRRLRDSVQVLQDLGTHREPRLTAIGLESVVSDVLRLVQSEAIARHVILDREVSTELPAMYADAAMLREAALSLLLDAIENTDATQPSARVMLSTRLVDDTHVELVVSHRRGPRTPGGRGWAFSVARSVAEAHGASISVVEDSDSGVTVRTVWPTQRERLIYPS